MFKGLKVIELANVLAGPMVGMFFSELGATVIKVENSTTNGDMTRGWKLPSEDKNKNISAYYSSVNYQKEVWFLDLKSKEHKDKIYQEIKTADIVISNFKKTSAQDLGMDHQSLSNINSRLIYAQITGFGDDSERPAYDLVLQAETGFMFMNGQPGSPPTKMPVALIDVLAAHQLKEGILTALYQREKTGKGAFVSCSLYDAAIASLANQATNWLMANHIPTQMGSLHPNIAPYGEVFTTADKVDITLAVGTEKQFKKVLEILKIKDNSVIEKLNTNQKRVQNREFLFQVLAEKISNIPKQKLVHDLEKHLIPYGLIKNMKDVFETPSAKKLILEETIENTLTKRPKTAVFNIQHNY